MNNDHYEERLKVAKSIADQVTETMYRAADDEREAFRNRLSSKLLESMEDPEHDEGTGEMTVEFGRGESKSAGVAAYYLFYEFFSYVEYLVGGKLNNTASAIVYKMIEEYVQTHNISKESAKDRAMFIRDFLSKQGLQPSMPELEFDPFTEGQPPLMTFLKLPKFIEDLDSPSANKFKHEFYKQLRESGAFSTRPDIDPDDWPKKAVKINILPKPEYNIHDTELLMQINDGLEQSTLPTPEDFDELTENIMSAGGWKELLNEKDLRKRIKYAKSYQERRYYQQILGDRTKPNRHTKKKRRKK